MHDADAEKHAPRDAPWLKIWIGRQASDLSRCCASRAGG